MTWVQLQSIPSRQRGTKSNRPKLPPTMKGFKYQKARRILKNRVTSQHNSTSHPFYQFTIGGIKHSKTLGELDRKIFKPLCSMKSKHFSRFTQTLKTLKDEWTTHCIQLNMVNYSLYFPITVYNWSHIRVPVWQICRINKHLRMDNSGSPLRVS